MPYFKVLVAHDLPDLHPFDRALPLNIFAPEDFVSDRIGFFPQPIERGHVFVLHHEQDIEVLWVRIISDKNFVIHAEALLFHLIIRGLVYLGQSFEVIIAHPRLCFHHCDAPYGTFCVRCVAPALRLSLLAPRMRQALARLVEPLSVIPAVGGHVWLLRFGSVAVSMAASVVMGPRDCDRIVSAGYSAQRQGQDLRSRHLVPRCRRNR
jgi:hypothetical protein